MPTTSSAIAAPNARPWRLRQALGRRFAECGLVLHPEKTKLVYCKDTNRKGEYRVSQFDFLGYTFRPRLAKWRGGLYGVSFLPAASPKALKAIRQAIRRLGAPDPERQGAGRHGPDVQSVHPRLGQLLQPLLQVGVVSDASPDRCPSAPVGAHASSSASATSEGRAGLAGTGGPGHRRLCLPIGRFCMVRAGHWEPYEPRGSRTVLGARGGEIPRATRLPSTGRAGSSRARASTSTSQPGRSCRCRRCRSGTPARADPNASPITPRIGSTSFCRGTGSRQPTSRSPPDGRRRVQAPRTWSDGYD